MAQLRNVLRAQLFAGAAPAQALNELNAFCVHLMPRAFATVVAARIELGTGSVEAASAGHLMPFITNSGPDALPAPIRLSPPIGVRDMTYQPSSFSLEPGHGLVMYSDGLVERRRASIDEGLERLAETLRSAGDAPASWISTAMASGDTDDDVTILTLYRR
jgi:chemotaxis family two-component system sensor kinase Cph1